MKKLSIILSLVTVILLSSCGNSIDEVNIGFIGPLTKRAVDLGVGPAKALELAVKEYNETKSKDAPTVNLFIEDDQWEKTNAIPAYDKLRKEHNIQVLFISNTGGTVALQDKITQDRVILINQINSDKLLSSLNRNTFKVAKRTEEAHEILGARIAQLNLKNALIYHFPNDFMTRGAKAVESSLNDFNISNKIIEVKKDQISFKESLKKAKFDSVDAIVFLGYRNFGFAMKEAREMGINAQFFGSTTLFDYVFHDNSEGTIIGTECTYFTTQDGNTALGKAFIERYEKLHLNKPNSVWPAMQAYDAGNIVLNAIENINAEVKGETFEEWLRSKLHRVTFHEGVCGNLSIGPDGSSKGIYFSMYKYLDKNKAEKIIQ